MAHSVMIFSRSRYWYSVVHWYSVASVCRRLYGMYCG